MTKATSNHITEAVDTPVVHQQAEEKHHVGVAVDHGVEKRAEDGDLVVAAGHAAVDHVKDASAKDDQACEEKHAIAVCGVGVAKQKCGSNVDDEPDEGKDVRRNAGERQAKHDAVK